VAFRAQELAFVNFGQETLYRPVCGFRYEARLASRVNVVELQVLGSATSDALATQSLAG
jgi:hypothetical protein